MEERLVRVINRRLTVRPSKTLSTVLLLKSAYYYLDKPRLIQNDVARLKNSLAYLSVVQIFYFVKIAIVCCMTASAEANIVLDRGLSSLLAKAKPMLLGVC